MKKTLLSMLAFSLISGSVFSKELLEVSEVGDQMPNLPINKPTEEKIFKKNIDDLDWVKRIYFYKDKTKKFVEGAAIFYICNKKTLKRHSAIFYLGDSKTERIAYLDVGKENKSGIVEGKNDGIIDHVIKKFYSFSHEKLKEELICD